MDHTNFNEKTSTMESKMDHTNFYLTSGNLARGVVGLVDVMLARGAIKGEEVGTIGQLRDAATAIAQMAESYETKEKTDTAPAEEDMQSSKD